MPEDPRWIHDPARDGAGCSWCGAYAQVNDECECRECWEKDNPEGPPDDDEWINRAYMAQAGPNPWKGEG
jgi:hypothetical protein